MKELLIISFYTLLPVLELRGGLPIAVLYYDFPIFQSYLLCTFINILVCPLVFIFLSTFHKFYIKWDWYSHYFEKIINRARKKLEPKLKKYGYWGLMIFVGIPLPITGVYTGTLGAWILGMNIKKIFLATVAGVFISGIILSLLIILISYFGEDKSNILNFFAKIFIKEI
jgi:uncharacterized membrane protein